jgi:hypothetical protein
MNDDAQSTKATVGRQVVKGENEVFTRDLRYKQAIVPGGIPIVPKWIMRLLHLA